jgi:bifunctional DNA-binding transcriptional regulator/antitoxin component of YhaV-PrlF toxin-antitoxin module
VERLINRRQQGDLGEISAVEWLTRKGALVALPFGHSPDFDLVAEIGGRLWRVQVKTSTQEVRTPNGHLRFSVSLVTCGGNQSWTGVAKVFDPMKADYLFALTSGGRRWFIPAADLDGKRAVQLGGTKYSEFEIEPAAPIRELVYGDNAALKSQQPGEYPSGQRTAAVNRQALPSQVRILPPPSTGNSVDPPAVGRTKMSSHYQVAVPRAVAAAADIEPGDRFRVEFDGTGRFVMTRIEEYMEQHLDQLALTDESEAREPAGPERRAPD